MARKPFRGNYVNLEVRVSYDVKTDSIHLTSTDKDLETQRGFHLALNGGKEAEYALRGLLERKGLIPEDRFKTIGVIAHLDNSTSRDTWDQFPLGVFANGEEAIWSSQRSNVLLAGNAGGSTAVMVRSIISHCVRHSDKWRVFGIDFHKVNLTPYLKCDPTVQKVAMDLNAAKDLVDYLHSEMMNRYENMDKEDVNHFLDLNTRLHSLLLIIDEAWPVFAKTGGSTAEMKADDATKDELMHKISEIADLGRIAGINLVISTKKIYNEFIPANIMQDLSLRIAAGRMDADASQALLGNHEALNLPGQIRGRGYFQQSGEGAHFQSYWSHPDSVFPSPLDTIEKTNDRE